MISIGYMTVRRSHPEVLVKKAVLWNFAKLTRKPLCQSLFFNKVAGLRSLPQLFSFELCEISNNTFFYTLTAQLFFIKKKIISLDFIFLCLNTFQSINAWPIVRNTAAQKFYLFLELVNISPKRSLYHSTDSRILKHLEITKKWKLTVLNIFISHHGHSSF